MSFLKSLLRSKSERLMDAVKENDEGRVEKELRTGANPNDPDQSGTAPIHMAVAKGSTPLVKLLIEAGADVNLRMKDDDMTPLHCAAWQIIQNSQNFSSDSVLK